MAKKKMYNILIKDRRSDSEGKLPWYRPADAQCVSRQFTLGFIAATKASYPCPDIKIILCDENDPLTREGSIVEEVLGNGEVHVP
jgi:hypothetical protein